MWLSLSLLLALGGQASPPQTPVRTIPVPTPQERNEEWLVGACAEAMTFYLAGAKPSERPLDCFGADFWTARLMKSAGLTLPTDGYSASVTFDDPRGNSLNYTITLKQAGQVVGKLVSAAPDLTAAPSQYYLDRRALAAGLSESDWKAVYWGVACLDSFKGLMKEAEVLRSFSMPCGNSTLNLETRSRFPAIARAAPEMEIEAFMVVNRTASRPKVEVTGVNVQSGSGRWFSLRWSRAGDYPQFNLPRVVLGKSPVD